MHADLLDPEGALDIFLTEIILPSPLERIGFFISHRDESYTAAFVIEARKDYAFHLSSEALAKKFEERWIDVSGRKRLGIGYVRGIEPEKKKLENFAMIDINGSARSRIVSIGDSGTAPAKITDKTEHFIRKILDLTDITNAVLNSCYQNINYQQAKAVALLDSEVLRLRYFV